MNKLYPIYWNGREWSQDQVGDLFSTLYRHPIMLRSDKSVYLSDGLCVYPDDTMLEDD